MQVSRNEAWDIAGCSFRAGGRGVSSWHDLPNAFYWGFQSAWHGTTATSIIVTVTSVPICRPLYVLSLPAAAPKAPNRQPGIASQPCRGCNLSGAERRDFEGSTFTDSPATVPNVLCQGSSSLQIKQRPGRNRGMELGIWGHCTHFIGLHLRRPFVGHHHPFPQFAFFGLSYLKSSEHALHYRRIRLWLYDMAVCAHGRTQHAISYCLTMARQQMHTIPDISLKG